MYRTGGIIALLIGIALALLWAFLPFTQEHAYRVSFEDGRPSWTRGELACPPPWSVLIRSERPATSEYAVTGEECVRPARTLFAGAVVALLAGLALGAYGWSRGPRPSPERIEPISRVIGRRSRGPGSSSEGGQHGVG